MSFGWVMQTLEQRKQQTRQAVHEQSLIDQAVCGDRNAYAQLVQKYQDRLYGSMLNYVGSPEVAEDIVQDAFVQAFVCLRDFRGECRFYTWLYRIALNTRGKYSRYRRNMTSLEDSENRTDNSQPIDEIQRREIQREVRKAISQLGEDHRRILILREFEGLDYREISEVLNVGMGTVRSRLARARASLRQQLAPYQQSSM